MIKTDIFIVGAGMAGLTCAYSLNQAGLNVVCADKARGSGGRLSSKRIKASAQDISFDLGALSFSADSHEFKHAVNFWCEQGVAGHWFNSSDTSHYVGMPRSSSITRWMSDQLDVRFTCRISEITSHDEGWQLYYQLNDQSVLFAQCQHLILAAPVAQTFELLPSGHEFKPKLNGMKHDPQWVVMLGLDQPLNVKYLLENPNPVFERISYENSKPGRQNTNHLHLYCFQASKEWSMQYLDDSKEEVLKLLIKEAQTYLKQPLNVKYSHIHKWLYSQGTNMRQVDAGFLTSEDGLSICGDYLLSDLPVGGVEKAFLSGQALAAHLIKQNSLAKVG